MIAEDSIIPEIQHTGAGYVIGPGTMVMLVIAVVVVMPFAKWAALELYEQLKRRRQEADGLDPVAVPTVAQAVQRLTDEIRMEFSAVRDLISGHNAQLVGQGRDLANLTARVDRLEHQVDELRAK